MTTAPNIGLPGRGVRTDYLDRLERFAEAAGVALPKPYLNAAADHRAVLRRARVTLEAPATQSLAAAMVDALTADRDPATDPAVITALNANAIAEQSSTVYTLLSTREGAILRDHRDAIVKACAKPVEAAYAAITEAAHVAPGMHRNTPAEAVLRAGAQASTAWTAARDAQDRLRAVTGMLRCLPKVRIKNEEEQWLHLEPTIDLDSNALASEWDAALAGATLSWCGDYATYRGRLAALADMSAGNRQHQQTEAEAARHAGAKAIADGWARSVGAAQ